MSRDYHLFQLIFAPITELPNVKEDIQVFVITKTGNMLRTSYSPKYKAFNVYDWYNSESIKTLSLNDHILYWAPFTKKLTTFIKKVIKENKS